jgi:triphosphoribosyl-dephospho-CoA synthase
MERRMESSVSVCENIARYALQSLLYEVSAAPKPGLVDWRNAGAHQDMDFFTFMASSAALPFYFYRCAMKGKEFAGRDARELFQALRGIGREAERAMFEATGGVNTHKGLIFSLGVISAAAACAMIEFKTDKPGAAIICRKTAAMTEGLCQRELAGLNQHSGLTHGEKLYRKYGLRGIRGEVESGFATVRSGSLPLVRKLKAEARYHLNDILVQALLYLMTVNEDTNIAARHDQNTLDYVKKYAAQVLENGGMLSPRGKQMVYEMDEEFIRKNISPGGSADLLAVTVMLDLLEN